MSNHQDDRQPKPEAEKVKLSVIISDQPPTDKNVGGSSLTTESEKVQRKEPRKPRKYPSAATREEIRAQRIKRTMEGVANISWLTTAAAAFYLGTTPAALRQMVKRKQIVAYKPFAGRKLYFKKSDLDRAFESATKVGGIKWQ